MSQGQRRRLAVDESTAAIRQTSAAVATHDRQLLRDLADWVRWEVEGG